MSLEGGSDEDPLYASADEVLQNSASAKSKVEFSYEDISLLTSNRYHGVCCWQFYYGTAQSFIL